MAAHLAGSIVVAVVTASDVAGDGVDQSLHAQVAIDQGVSGVALSALEGSHRGIGAVGQRRIILLAVGGTAHVGSVSFGALAAHVVLDAVDTVGDIAGVVVLGEVGHAVAEHVDVSAVAADAANFQRGSTRDHGSVHHTVGDCELAGRRRCGDQLAGERPFLGHGKQLVARKALHTKFSFVGASLAVLDIAGHYHEGTGLFILEIVVGHALGASSIDGG